MKTRKRMGVVLAMVVVVLAVVAAAAGYLFNRNYCVLAGKPYRRSAETLDLSGVQGVEFSRLGNFPNLKEVNLRNTGVTVEEYQALRQALPGCQIEWLVPFQGQYLEPDTQEVTVADLTEADAQALALVTGLKRVDAMGCRDYGALEALMALRPDCDVAYRVALGGRLWDPDTEALELDTLDVAELRQNLPYLHQAEQLLLTMELPDAEKIAQIRQDFPELTLFYSLGNQDIPMDAGTKLLLLSGFQLTVDRAQALLACYPNLKEAEMLDCGLTQAEMEALCDAFPDTFLLWEADFGPLHLRTDVEEADLTGCEMEDPAALEEMLPYFPRLQKVIMTDCGLDNETMDALDKRHEDVRFVWTVDVGEVRVRTDSLFFAPVKTGQRVYQGQMDNLKYCPDIIAVDVGHMKLTTCEWVEYMPKLQYLIIADSWISDISPLEGCKNLIFLEMFQTLCRDYTPLLGCTALEDLNLCYTYGSAEPIRKMTWLKRLWWDGIGYADQDIAKDLPNTEVNLESGSSTGGTWRQGQRYKEQRDILGMAYLVG